MQDPLWATSLYDTSEFFISFFSPSATPTTWGRLIGIIAAFFRNVRG